jgi:amidase
MVSGLEIDPACRDAASSLASALERLGHRIVPVELGEDSVVAEAFRDVWSVVAASHEADDEAALAGFTRMMREHGRKVTSLRFHESLTMFRGVAQMLDEFVFSNVDLLITPTLAALPPERGAFTASPDEEENFALMGRFMPYTPLYNIAGLPAISVPIGTAQGLPVGAMIGGPYGSEYRMLSEVNRVIGNRGEKGLAPAWT